MQTKQILEFGPLRLDSHARRLYRDGELVPLTPKLFDTLLFLVTNSERVLSKEEILHSVWSDRVVDEANVMQNISVLRRTLGEAENGTPYIVNFPGKGYRFTMPVYAVPASAEVPLDEGRSGARPWFGKRSVLFFGGITFFVALVALWYTMRPAANQIHETRRSPVTRLAGSEWLPSVSADGHKVAFVWDEAGKGASSIFVTSPGEDNPRRMFADSERYSSPVWSPDGRTLACIRFGEGAASVVLIPEHGGSGEVIAGLFPRRYGLDYRRLDWSPDGRSVIFDDKQSDEEPFSLFQMDLLTRRRTRLVKPDPASLGDLAPRLSPDGKWLSFIRKNTGHHSELMVVPSAGGIPRNVSNWRAEISSHDWVGPSTLMFSSNRAGEYRLWSISPDGGEPVPAIKSVVSSAPLQFSVARSASRLVFSEFRKDLNIWRLDLQQRRGSPPVWKRLIDSTGEDLYPQYSPDGKSICFRSDRSGDPQLWISNAEGGDARQLTQGRRLPTIPRWSPDGEAIVFGDQTDNGIHLSLVRSGITRRLAVGSGNAPVFLGTGSEILFNRGNSLWKAKLPDGPAELVENGVGFPKDVSRDGSGLYYMTGRTGKSIYRRALPAGPVTEVVHDLLPGYWGSWALSGNLIWYLSGDPAKADRTFVSFLRSDSREAGAFTEFQNLPAIGQSMWSVSPDGRHLLCVRGDPTPSDVTMLELASRGLD